MDDTVLLTFHCAAGEADAIARCLRSCTDAPIQVRAETVHGRDFSDAQIGEQVTGKLQRAAVEVVTQRGSIDAFTAAVRQTRRSHPVRWHAIPVIACGRMS